MRPNKSQTPPGYRVQTKRDREGGVIYMPTGDRARRPQGKLHPSAKRAARAAAYAVERRKGGQWVRNGTWRYRDASGREYARVLRFDSPAGDAKTFMPIHRDGRGWRVGDPARWVPYQLNELPADGPTVVVEGEKAADALAAIGMAATTNAHGSRSAEKTDWSPLAGRDVIVWPDKDDAGTEHANALAAILTTLDPPATVRVIDPPASLPEKGDAADWLEARPDADTKWTRAAILAMAERARRVPARPSGPLTFAELERLYPELHPPVVDKLLREGEVANVIAPPKVGKSWLAGGLALSVVAGRRWLGAFDCSRGPVLMIDNELHPATIRHRIPLIADAMGVDAVTYGDMLDVLPLRGLGTSMINLQWYIDRVRAGRYRLIVADAWYRFIPEGMNENANADVMALYNLLDAYAASTNAAWVVVHHTSKGEQGDKSVTDVGAGAGAQSRAADCHLILRPHEDDGAVVLEAATRSFPPVEPIGLRWEFPLWKRDDAVDPDRVRGKDKQAERQREKDTPRKDKIMKALAEGELTINQVVERIGQSRPAVSRLLDQLHAEGRVTYTVGTVPGSKEARLYCLVG